MTITLDKRTGYKMMRNQGHYYIDVLIVSEGGTDDDYETFMYDTGAYITVLCRNVYETHKFDALPRFAFPMKGYGGGVSPGVVYTIPGLKIGRRLLTDVWAYTPDSYELEENILGANVIEYFMTVQDNDDDYIYFLDNANPKPYYDERTKVSLACGDVFALGDT